MTTTFFWTDLSLSQHFIVPHNNLAIRSWHWEWII